MQKINENTTYSELKTMIADARGRKMQGKTLIRSDEPILISVKQDSAAITVYENGFFVYRDDQGRVTARAVWNCTEMIFEQAVGRAQSITEDVFGELPFPVVLSHFGARNIEDALNKKEANYGQFSLNGEGVEETTELSVPDFADEVCERLDGKDIQNDPIQKMLKAIPEAVSVLKDRQREIIELLYFNEETLSQDDIAARLGIGKSSVSITLKRALTNLQKYYNEKFKKTSN